jgi:predicted TPR repeat methyltransferase
LRDVALGELANGRPAAALTALRRGLSLDPQLAVAQETLGMALEELGRFTEAEAAYREGLRLDATCADAPENLAKLLRHLGRFEEAVHWYREALARRPEAVGLLLELGESLWKIRDSTGALAAFERAVAASPGSAEAHYNLGSAQLELGQFAAAHASARESLRLRPEFTEALILSAAALAAADALESAVGLLDRLGGRGVPIHQRYVLLAGRLMSSRLLEPARRCLELALREEPGEVIARHLLAALSGENPDHPCDGYVRRLFDASAATFDQDLVAKLGYGIPGEMVAALRGIRDAPDRPWDVLDLGCGTGLVGVEIAPDSRRLVGVDLAPNMVEQARQRQLYTELRCADIAVALALDEAQYDVVTAADVFIYVGKLDEVIPAVRRVLKSGGMFACSAEAAEAMDGVTSPVYRQGYRQGYRLGSMGRYAHSAAYLRRLAAQNGFYVALLREARIRFEHRRPVPGWLTIWRAV